MNVTLKMSGNKARTLKWLLGLRYGESKKLETLLGMAIWDIAHEVADNVINNQYLGVEQDTDGQAIAQKVLSRSKQ